MALLSHKFQRLLKKKLSFKTANHGHTEYKTLEEFEKDEKKGCCAPRGYVHVYVGEYEPQILYRVPTGAFNSPAFAALLDEYEDDIGDSDGPISVPCSAMDFEQALCRALIK